MKAIIVFGAGKWGKALTKFNPQRDVKILFVCDNNSELWGESINGIEIKSPQGIKEEKFDKLIICGGGEMACEATEQVFSYGISRDQIIYSYSPYALEYCTNPLDEYFVIPKKEPEIQFHKGPAVIYDDYVGETYKSHERRMREGFFEKYCQGEGIDIGYGSDLIVPGCSGWDIRNGDAQYLREVKDESFDFVYSSHCLEHLWDVRVSLKNWFRVLKRGGYLIIAVPHRDLYEKKKVLPSRWNGDHKHMFLIGESDEMDTLDIVEEVSNSLVDYQIQYVKMCDDGHTISDPLIHSDGEYQIEMVIKKC